MRQKPAEKLLCLIFFILNVGNVFFIIQQIIYAHVSLRLFLYKFHLIWGIWELKVEKTLS